MDKQDGVGPLFQQDNYPTELVEKAKQIAKTLDFPCQFLEHSHTNGRKSENAAKALGVEKHQIIKCLFLNSRKKKLIFAIVRGDTTLAMKKLEKATGEKKFSLVAKNKLFPLTGFLLGGIPPFIGFHLGVPVYVDSLVLSEEYVYGSGGSPFVGLRFRPHDLVEKGAVNADIAELNDSIE